MRRATALASAFLLAWSNAAVAGAAGVYRADEGPELAAELLLRADGTYAYAMAVGALDERSQGRWREADGAISFVTEPKPVSPEFRRAAQQPAEVDSPFLLVTWPNGRGIAGIDFRIVFDEGHPITGYTQEDGWAWPAGETRIPRAIELAEPIHGVTAPPFAIEQGSKAFHFELVPNDLGVVDFGEASARIVGNRLLLQRPDGTIKFVKAAR